MLVGSSVPASPKLAVVISIDQFRRDYVRRYENLYLPPKTGSKVGGFRWLLSAGSNFINSRYNHIPTYTGPGHAVIGTGSCPSLNGIIDNSWLDRSTGKEMYVVSDPKTKDILTGSSSMSPRNELSTTFGDELKLATNGQSKSVSIAIKDRAAILMIGHLADACLWMDKATGYWTSSDFYFPSGKLPDWVVALNKEEIPSRNAGMKWEPHVSATALSQAIVATTNSGKPEFGKQFPHTPGDPKINKSYFDNWTFTPWANDYVFETALRAVDQYHLGGDATPDVLTINLSTNDYVGHAFGPYSPEAMDLSVETDKALSHFFNGLDAKIGLKNVMIFVTADHGVLPLPEDITRLEMPGGRLPSAAITAPVKEALTKKYGDANMLYPGGIQEYMIYLNHEVCAARGIDTGEAQQVIRKALLSCPQVFNAYAGEDIQRGLPGDFFVNQMVNRSYERVRSGDVLYYLKPGYLYGDGSAGTSHGSPWAYDTNVPLLIWSPTVTPGNHSEPAGPEDIAATICQAFGISNTTANVGRSLSDKR